MATAFRPTERLLDDIYDAAANDSLWPAVMRKIASLAGGAGGVVHGFSLSTHCLVSNLSYIGGLDEACLRTAQDRYLDNPWSQVMRRQPSMKLVVSDDVVPLRVLSRTDFYNECVRPQKLPHNGMASLIRRDDTVLAFNISRHKPFGHEHRRVLEQLLPDVRRAFMLGLRFDGYKALHGAQRQALNQLSEGIVLMDRGGRVLFANRAARTCNGLSLSSFDGRLRVLAAWQQRLLDGAMQSVAQGAGSATVRLEVPGGPNHLNVLIVRARESVLDRLAPHGLGGVALMMFIRDPQRMAQVPAQRLAALYGLTPAECRVALAAAKGLGTADVSDALQLSTNTTKTHMRRIYSKMGIERHAQLVRLIQSLDLG